MPENAVSITRPGRWGNPFKVGIPVGDLPYREFVRATGIFGEGDFLDPDRIVKPGEAVELFRRHLRAFPGEYPKEEELRGRDLACFCRLDSPCHGDVLLSRANVTG